MTLINNTKKFKEYYYKNQPFDNLTLIQKIFSIRNENNHKVLTILGIKIKFKRGKNNA